MLTTTENLSNIVDRWFEKSLGYVTVPRNPSLLCEYTQVDVSHRFCLWLVPGWARYGLLMWAAKSNNRSNILGPRYIQGRRGEVRQVGTKHAYHTQG